MRKNFHSTDNQKFNFDIYSVTIKQLRKEVKATLIASGHRDLTDLLPYLEVGNQDQIATLQIMLPWVYPNGRSHCSDPKVIETEAPNNDMVTVDLKTQDTQLDPKQNPMPKKVIETEAPKNDMVTVDLNTQDTQLNPKQNPVPKKTMTPKYKFKRIKKSGKVQKIQSPGVHKMKFKPSHRNERIYWSKQLCCVNNVSHDSNSFALHNFCHIVTSNINGLHTVTYPQNMWLLKRPRVKIK